jgi:hypothetical protein
LPNIVTLYGPPHPKTWLPSYKMRGSNVTVFGE